MSSTAGFTGIKGFGAACEQARQLGDSTIGNRLCQPAAARLAHCQLSMLVTGVQEPSPHCCSRPPASPQPLLPLTAMARLHLTSFSPAPHCKASKSSLPCTGIQMQSRPAYPARSACSGGGLQPEAPLLA